MRDFRLIKVPLINPHQAYRKKIEAYIKEEYAEKGEFSSIIETALEKYQQKLNKLSKSGFSLAESQAIKNELLLPIREYLQHLEEYKKIVYQVLEEKGSLDQVRQELKILQSELGLTSKEADEIEAEISLSVRSFLTRKI